MLQKLLTTILLSILLVGTINQKAYALLQAPGGVLIPRGGIYTHATVPYAIKLENGSNNISEIVNISDKKSTLKLKKGESSAINILGLVEMGDAGIYKAAKSAGIKQVYYVDVIKEKLYAYYFYYTKITTVVYGE